MLIADTADHSSYESLGRTLALESVAQNALGIMDVFSRLMQKSDDVISSFVAPLKEFASPDKETVNFSDSQYRETLKRVNTLPFMSYQNVLVMVPEGFTGNLPKYLEFLTKINADTLGEASTLLNDYTLELSAFISNVDNRKSLKSHEAFYKKVRENRVHVEKELKQYFSQKDVRSRIPLGQVIRRFSDFSDVFTAAERLKKSAYSNKELNVLLGQVAHASELLKLIKGMIDENRIEVLSGDMAKHISEGAYEVAKYIELVSLMSFSIEIALSTVKALADQFRDITN